MKLVRQCLQTQTDSQTFVFAPNQDNKFGRTSRTKEGSQFSVTPTHRRSQTKKCDISSQRVVGFRVHVWSVNTPHSETNFQPVCCATSFQRNRSCEQPLTERVLHKRGMLWSASFDNNCNRVVPFICKGGKGRVGWWGTATVGQINLTGTAVTLI